MTSSPGDWQGQSLGTWHGIPQNPSPLHAWHPHCCWLLGSLLTTSRGASLVGLGCLPSCHGVILESPYQNSENICLHVFHNPALQTWGGYASTGRTLAFLWMSRWGVGSAQVTFPSGCGVSPLFQSCSITAAVFSRESAEETFWGDPYQDPSNIIYSQYGIKEQAVACCSLYIWYVACKGSILYTFKPLPDVSPQNIFLLWP